MISDVSLAVTAFGVLGAWFSLWFGLRKSNREQARHFEATYIQRYWKIHEQLSLDVLRASGKDSGLEVKVGPEDEKAIRSYIILCEDELEQRAEGHITDTTYREWSEGICQQFRNPMFMQVWEEVKREPVFPYKHLKELLKPIQSYDPLHPPETAEEITV